MLGMQDVGTVQKILKPNSATAFLVGTSFPDYVSKPREHLHYFAQSTVESIGCRLLMFKTILSLWPCLIEISVVNKICTILRISTH